jgi:protein TonB
MAAPPVNYTGMLFAALKRATRYPQRARLRRIEGTAVVNITMRRDGTVTNWNIVRGTGNEDLDEAAGEAIERASPLPAPPAEVPGDPVRLQMPIAFTLR